MIRQRGRTFTAVVSITKDGKRTRLYKTFDNRIDAEQWESQTLAVKNEPTSVEHGTMLDLLGRCKGLDWHGKEASQVRNAARLCRSLGSLRPSEVTSDLIDRLLLGWRSQGYSNATCRRYLSALRVMLTRARRLGWIDQLPLFPESRLLKEAEPRSLVVHPEWLAALLDEMDRREYREEARLTLFLYHIGCRVGEALNLERDRIDSRYIVFVNTKGHRARRIPIPSVVRPLLKGDGRMLFNIKYYNYHRHYRACVDAVCQRLGLGESIRQQWCVHSLRHTCLTRLAQKGWSAPAIQAWGGHRSLAVTQRYVHASAVDLEALVDC